MHRMKNYQRNEAKKRAAREITWRVSVDRKAEKIQAGAADGNQERT